MSAGEYDVVVVGAGSAGCAVAARLAERGDRRVLLIEAGGDGRSDPRIAVPLLFVTLQRFSGRDWGFRTEPQRGLGGRRLEWPRGRVLGGSSATNFLVFIRGHRGVYDAWRDAGCDGWGYDDLLPAFRRLETHPLGPSRWHGGDGPVHIDEPDAGSPLTEAFLESAAAAGLERTDDFDGAQAEGAGRYFVTTRAGRRESAATAYLERAPERPNLTIRTDAMVDRVVIDGTSAAGVELHGDDGAERVLSGAVVVCAGAVGSPAILMRSGVGPERDLAALGAPVVVDRDEVGANLADHLLAPVVFSGGLRETLPVAALWPPAVIDYVVRGQGPWSSNVAEAGAIVRTGSDGDLPDLQLTFGLGSMDPRRALLPSFSMGVVGLRPSSRGRVRLRARDAATPPAIDPGYLTEPDDIAPLVEGVRLARRIAGVGPLAEACGHERQPGADVESDRDIAGYIRRRVQTSFHPVGTCRMGGDANAVVDPRLRVRGVDGLWVADASIMPTIPSANTNAACLMIGERAAELIDADLAAA